MEFRQNDDSMSNISPTVKIGKAEGVAICCPLPDEAFAPAWTAIKLDERVRHRLLAQALLALSVRQELSFEDAPLHGLILLSGVPGTGKTTLARGLANEVAAHLPDTRTTFAEIDPHALTSSALGRSQQSVAKLFEQTLPELAMEGVAVVLLDEVETLAVSRRRLSPETNPADVHRATDAVLSGMDRLTREHGNVLLVATTNFPDALDEAVLSRADHIEEIGLPDAAARRAIIGDTLTAVSGVWKGVQSLISSVDDLARDADGLDGRRIRKAIFAAMASDIKTAKDPNQLTAAQIKSAFCHALQVQRGAIR